MDLTNQVEGHTLRKKTSFTVCRFLLEEAISKDGCVGQVIVIMDSKEVNTNEGIQSGGQWGGHSPIVKALIKACERRVKL